MTLMYWNFDVDNDNYYTVVVVVAAADDVAIVVDVVVVVAAVDDDDFDRWPGGHRCDCLTKDFVRNHNLCPPAPLAF